MSKPACEFTEQSEISKRRRLQSPEQLDSTTSNPTHESVSAKLQIIESVAAETSSRNDRRCSYHPTNLDLDVLKQAGIEVDPITKKVFEYKSALEPLARFSIISEGDLHDGSPSAGSRLTDDRIDKAEKIFAQHGFAILDSFLSSHVCDEMKNCLDCIMRDIRAVDADLIGIRAQKRYTVSDTMRSQSLLHEPSFIKAWNELHEKGLTDLLRKIFQAEPRLYNAGAQVVLDGCTYYQYLHADTPHVFNPHDNLFAGMPSSYEVTPRTEGVEEDEDWLGGIPLRWLQRLPESIDVNIVLEDWTWESGAPRILPGRHFYEMLPRPDCHFSLDAYPQNLMEEMELYAFGDDHRARKLEALSGNVGETTTLTGTEWWRASASPLRSQIFPVPKGTVIIRDVNTIHGGCPNLSSRDRLMPAFVFEPKEYTDMRAALAEKGEWDQIPGHWGWPQVSREQVSLLHPDISRDNAHLLPENLPGSEARSDYTSYDLGFSEEKLRKLVAHRVRIFEKYKRRDEYYNIGTEIREKLGKYLPRRPFRHEVAEI